MKIRTDTQKILVFTFAFVMITSLVLPAYADRTSYVLTEVPENTSQLATPESHNTIVFRNGDDPIPFSGFFIDNIIIAEDFVLGNSLLVTDAHFAFFCADTNNCPTIQPLLYFFYEDNNGEPGAVIDSGTAINVQLTPLAEVNHFEVSFDLENEIPFDAGTTYWFGLTYTAPFVIEDPEPVWLQTDQMIGNFPAFTSDGTNWFVINGVLDLWFALSADRTVGGESLPIDSTALILAGASANAVWIIPVLAGLAGAGIYLTRSKLNWI